MFKTPKINFIFILIMSFVACFVSTNCAAPKGGAELESELPSEDHFSYLNVSSSEMKQRSGEIMEEGEPSGGFNTDSRAANFADTFTFSVVCGNDASCFTTPLPSISASPATPKCYNLSTYAANVANNGTIPLVTSDNDTTKLFCRVNLNSFNYKNSGQNYLPASSTMSIDLDFRNSTPSLQTTYAAAGNGVQYNDSSGSNQGANLFNFYKYTNTSGSTNTAVGTINILLSNINSATGTTSGTATSAAGTSLADTVQSSTVFSPDVTSLTYQALPAVGSLVKQYTVYFTSAADLAGAAALTSSDNCRIFILNSAMTQVTIAGVATNLPTDIVTAQNLFLDANGNMLPWSNNTYEYVDCKANSFTAANSGSFFGVLNVWNTAIATPITNATASVTLESTTKARLVVFASDPTDTTSGATKKASRAFAMFKIPVTTSSTTAW